MCFCYSFATDLLYLCCAAMDPGPMLSTAASPHLETPPSGAPGPKGGSFLLHRPQ